MRKRYLLAVVAMLSMFLMGIGTAHAVLGVADDVPGTGIVVPVICGINDANGVNTLWAVAETGCYAPFVDPQITKIEDVDGVDTAIGLIDVEADWVLRNSCSATVLTGTTFLTCWDVDSFDCKSLTSILSANQKSQMTVTIGGVPFYAGYFTMDITNPTSDPVTAGPANDLISWVYLIDLTKGFAAGFNGISLENGAGARLEEDAGAGPIVAANFFPRYVIWNDDADTYTWWIFLAGRNQIGAAPSNDQPNGDGVIYACSFNNCSNSLFTRRLIGHICNEHEDCNDFELRIPRELNIINVEEILPTLGGLTSYPRTGFATLAVEERGDIAGTSITIQGTQDASVCTFTEGQYYSMFGWSHQRAAEATAALSWDVVHPMHRLYCSDPEGMTYIDGPDCLVTTFSAP